MCYRKTCLADFFLLTAFLHAMLNEDDIKCLSGTEVYPGTRELHSVVVDVL